MDGPRAFQAPTFADRILTEEAQVKSGTGTGCGHTCPGCHGALTCIREQHDDTMAHVGRDADGQLVQWIGPCDDDTHTAAQAAGDFLDGAAR